MFPETGGKMKEIELKRGFKCFNFPEQDGFDYGFNIYAIQDKGNILLIDAAFRSQMLALKSLLDKGGLETTHVLASHFHNDHIAGLMALPETVTVLGSPKYGETLMKRIPQNITPVSFEKPLAFGEHTLKFIPAPGHSRCSILTDIDGEYLHAGDSLMSRHDGRRILPWVERANIPEHIRSLEMMKEMKRTRLLLSHGPMLEGSEAISEEIDLRLHYLKAVLNPAKGLTLDEALPDSPDNWVCLEFFHQLIEASSERK